MQFKDFLKAMDKVCKFYDHELNEAQLRIFYEHVSALDIKHFRVATYHHIDTRRFFPTPGELFEYGKELAVQENRERERKEVRRAGRQERRDNAQEAPQHISKIIKLLDRRELRKQSQ